MLSILLVAVLTFLWSWLGPTHDYVFMLMTLSGTIFVGGLVWGRTSDGPGHHSLPALVVHFEFANTCTNDIIALL